LGVIWSESITGNIFIDYSFEGKVYNGDDTLKANGLIAAAGVSYKF